MKVRLYSPFNGMIGTDVISIDLSKESSLKEIIRQLIVTYPQFKAFIPADLTDEKLSKNLLFFKEGQVLRLDEKVGDEDELKVLPLLPGG